MWNTTTPTISKWWSVLISPSHHNHFQLHLGMIYRPPEGSVLQFYKELADYLENNIILPGDFLMMGDFNVPTNTISNPDTIPLMNTLESFGTKKPCINFATVHWLQNMLDLIIIEEDPIVITDTNQGSLLSDQNIVFILVSQIPSWITQLKWISYRKIKAIDMDLLKKDILLEILHHSDCNSSDKHVKLYNTSLTEIMDKHTALKKKVVSE